MWQHVLVKPELDRDPVKALLLLEMAYVEDFPAYHLLVGFDEEMMGRLSGTASGGVVSCGAACAEHDLDYFPSLYAFWQSRPHVTEDVGGSE